MDTQQEIESLVRILSPTGAGLVRLAYEFARCAHEGQRRRHGVPYIEHPVAVARLANELYGVTDAEVLAAALLHDVLEDTDATDLRAFPPRTVRLVELLTDPPERAGQRRRCDHMARLWEDPDATRLKACDRLANLSDSLLQYDPSFCARCAWKTRSELLGPDSPLPADPIAGPLLEEAVRRCEARAAGR